MENPPLNLHYHFLDQAFEFASTIDPHQTKSNPRVGCVVVQNEKIISKGVHEQFGEAHAEVNALKNLIPGWPGQNVQNYPGMKDYSVYVTLEPCVGCVGKKTAACTDLLIKLKPAEIVIGALDLHFPGQGVAKLQEAGIKVTVLNTNHHETLNPWFKAWITHSKPFITLKAAQSLDGKITPPLAAYQKGKRALTGPETQVVVHNLRAHHQAILTSTETLLEDDPKLDVRHAQNLDFSPTAPEVIVLGTRGIPENSKIYSVPNRKVHQLKTLNELTAYCQQQQMASILTECGGKLNTQLLETGLIHRIEVFTAPVFCGETAKPSFTKKELLSGFKIRSSELCGNDLKISLTNE